MRRLHPKEPLVFISKTGQPWSLRPGYDVSVWFPPEIIRRGRPTWLALGGERKPYYVSGDVCRHHFPCLVEARYANEGDDAIPADRLVLDPVPLDALPGQRVTTDAMLPYGELYLRPGKYHLTYSHVGAGELFSQDISVGNDAAASLEHPVGRSPSLQPSGNTACERAGRRQADCKLLDAHRVFQW